MLRALWRLGRERWPAGQEAGECLCQPSSHGVRPGYCMHACMRDVVGLSLTETELRLLLLCWCRSSPAAVGRPRGPANVTPAPAWCAAHVVLGVQAAVFGQSACGASILRVAAGCCAASEAAWSDMRAQGGCLLQHLTSSSAGRQDVAALHVQEAGCFSAHATWQDHHIIAGASAEVRLNIA